MEYPDTSQVFVLKIIYNKDIISQRRSIYGKIHGDD